MRFKRREFLELAAAISALAACKQRLSQAGKKSDTRLQSIDGRGKRVAILGGGIAGCCAGYHLNNLGFDVTILERTARVSGRAFTLTNYFEDGQYCELGATRIPDVHNLTKQLASELGIELVPLHSIQETQQLDANQCSYTFTPDNNLYYLEKIFRTRTKRPTDPLWPLDRAFVESNYAKRIFSELGNPHDEEWPFGPQGVKETLLRSLDSMTFSEYLAREPLPVGSPFAQTLIKAGIGSECEMVSALAWLGAEYLEQDWETTWRMKGGNQQMAERLTKELTKAGKVKLNATVTAVNQTGLGPITVYFESKKGVKDTIAADYVVCALPLDVLQKIDWQPGLSPAKLRASREVTMQAVTRINLQYSKRFWEQDPYQLRGLKVLHSDLPIERLWDMTGSADQKQRKSLAETTLSLGQCPPSLSDGTLSEKGILTCYVQHEHARSLGLLDEKERIKVVAHAIESCFPQSLSLMIKAQSWVWHQQDWIGGGWAAYKPGQIDLYQAVKKPEGRVVFAGDHCTLESGWMQGAIQSSLRALDELYAMMDPSREV